MMKAAEDLKQQQMLREQERQRVLQERILPLPDLDNVPDEELEEIAKKMTQKLLQLESEHYDINYIVRQKDFEINELTISVNDLRGKFVKPTLKKVSKTDNRFNKLKKKDRNFVDFRTNLKNVESNKFTLKEEKKESIVGWKKWKYIRIIMPPIINCFMKKWFFIGITNEKFSCCWEYYLFLRDIKIIGEEEKFRNQ